MRRLSLALAAAAGVACLVMSLPNSFAEPSGSSTNSTTSQGSGSDSGQGSLYSLTQDQSTVVLTATQKRKLANAKGGGGGAPRKKITSTHSESNHDAGGGRRRPTSSGVSSKSAGPSAHDLAIAKNAALADSYAKALTAANNCSIDSYGTAAGGGCAAPPAPNFVAVPAAPTAAPGKPAATAGKPAAAAPPAPTYTPEQAAYIALAKLTIPSVTPGIGPSPDLNQWKMAVVGYPYWLSATGATQAGPVTDQAGPLTVSLSAELSRMRFSMGDGGMVNCEGAGTPWSRAVQPGQASPSCGYRYQKASLPKGDYTVTATAFWTVTYQVHDTTGTIPDTTGTIALVRQGSAQLPVGELQALVR